MNSLLNKITHGDCLEVMQQIPDKSIDMILCDLPYGYTKNAWDRIIPFKPLWQQYERVIKDNGAIVLTANQPFASAVVTSNLRLFRYEWIWEKSQCNSHLNIHRTPLKRHENALVFYKKAPTFNPQKLNGVHPLSVVRFANPVKNRELTVEKPVELFEYFIETYTNAGDVVLDNCIGSGTTALACINTGRVFIGIDKTLKHVQAAQKRISGHQMPLGVQKKYLAVGEQVMFRPPVGRKLRKGVVMDVTDTAYTVQGLRNDKGQVETFVVPHNKVQCLSDYQCQMPGVRPHYVRKRNEVYQQLLEAK